MLCVLSLITAACSTGRPQPPPPEPAVKRQILGTVTVTAQQAIVYSSPGFESGTPQVVTSGQRLPLLSRSEGWLEVELAGARGWLRVSEVWPSDPCPSDRDDPLVLEEPVFQFTGLPGRVILEATFDAEGTLESLRVIENTVGDRRYEEIAKSDLVSLRLRPPVRNCRSLPFIYTFTRNF